jgi:hypothetical protein
MKKRRKANAAQKKRPFGKVLEEFITVTCECITHPEIPTVILAPAEEMLIKIKGYVNGVDGKIKEEALRKERQERISGAWIPKELDA